MTGDDPKDDRLREAFASLAANGQPAPPCPDPDALWRAAHGELAPEVARELVAHTARCPPCAEAWRLAREMEPEVAASAPRLARSPWFAMAAAVVVAIGALLFMRDTSDPPAEYRAGDEPVVRSLVAEDRPVPRERFELRWTPGPPGTSYDLRVATPALVTLTEARNLTDSRFVVPATMLAGLPARSSVLWQVEARFPDGRRATSATFTARLP
jgi:hypothetical protein